MQLCPFLMQEGCFDPWNHFLKTILELPVPQGEHQKSMHWKIKAIAAKLSYRVMLNYGMLTLTIKDQPENNEQIFGAMFVATMVPQLLESHMGLMFQSKTQFVPASVLDLSICFI